MRRVPARLARGALVDAPRNAARGDTRRRAVKKRATGLRSCYAVVAPGLERLAADELRAIKITPGTIEPGGVEFEADDAGVFNANLHLRTASRVIVRLAEFRATAFHELERLARNVRWEEFVPAGSPVRLRVTCRKSRLYHSDAVAQRVGDAIARRVQGVSVERAGGGKRAAGSDAEPDDDADAPADRTAQLFIVRFANDICTISADSSGELLHRRGYRLATAKAPLRETLAAGMLLAMGYDGSVPLVDPMCGAGTIAIEGALIARRIAPGVSRAFSCERWPAAPAKEFAALRAAARAAELPRALAPILASDRDAGAAEATLANAERAGVAGDIEIRRGALSGVTPPPGCGMLVTNPPYGVRASAGDDVRSLYAQLGNISRAKFAGWTIGFLSAERTMDAQVKLRLEEVLKFRNGGIPVRVMRGVVEHRMTRRDFTATMAALVAAPFALRAHRAFGGVIPRVASGDVLIAEFSDAGVKLRVSRVPKVVKSDAEWRKQLSPLGFSVTRKGDTEYAFSGAFWNLHEQGIFRCICCDT
ncbi:MAG: peptide-methionine (R)-S-oxide reductase, partial [Gemmatimonadaceae bacterium]